MPRDSPVLPEVLNEDSDEQQNTLYQKDEESARDEKQSQILDSDVTDKGGDEHNQRETEKQYDEKSFQ